MRVGSFTRKNQQTLSSIIRRLNILAAGILDDGTREDVASCASRLITILTLDRLRAHEKRKATQVPIPRGKRTSGLPKPIAGHSKRGGA